MPNIDFHRKKYPSADGNLQFAAAATTSTIKAAKTVLHTIFITKIIVFIKTSAAQTLTFQDTAGTPLVIAAIGASPTVNSLITFDFGENGVPLTLGKDLTATFSAAGLAGHIAWYGYQKI